VVPELRWLTIASVVETVSLVVLVVNRASAQPAVTSTVGPLHGFAYLATVAVAFLAPLATRTRLLTLVPGVGGLLALRSAGAPARDADEPEARSVDP
jgi:hypothetical protein